MDNILFQNAKIEERSYVSMVKREIHVKARERFSDTRTAQIDIVVAELLSNLIKHAKQGEILYRMKDIQGGSILEIICIDNGSGIKDLQNMMKDGMSSKNTLGHGLGAITRLCDFSQIYSQPGNGTIIYCVFKTDPDVIIEKSKLLIGCINIAKPGEKVSGDGIQSRFFTNKSLIFVADGLGHGEHAKQAVDTAITIFDAAMTGDPSELLKEIHSGVKKTRGMVATVVLFDHGTKKINVCGVGNIHLRIQSGLEYKNYIGNNGIVGLNIPTRLENAEYDLHQLQMLILCSDGIKTKWDLVQYPGILRYDPMVIAAAIYRDQARHNDDMTVLIAKVA